MFRREQRGGDGQGGTADDGPGGEPGGEPGGDPGGERKAPAREAVWRLGQRRGRLQERWSRRRAWLEANPGAELDQRKKSPVQAGIRLMRQGRLLRLVSSFLPEQPHASTRCMMGCELGCFTNLHRLSARGPVPNVMLKLELQRWPRTSDACGLSPNGSIMAAPSRLPTLGTLLQEGVATAARADLTSSQLGIL